MSKMLQVRVIAQVLLSLLLLSVAVVSGCADKKPKLTVEGVQAERSATVANSMEVYLKIRNEGAPDTLRGVRTNLRGAEAYIGLVADNRVVKKTDQVSVPAGGTVEFQSGGTSIVVRDIPKEVAAGEAITLTLIFEKSGEKQLQLTMPRGAGKPAVTGDGKSMTVRD